MEFKIEEVRKKKKITLYKLSKMTGISKTYLKDLEENKKINPSLLILLRIALALNVKIDDLFTVDIEKLREKLHQSVDETGFSSQQTIAISKTLDMLINIEMQKSL